METASYFELSQPPSIYDHAQPLQYTSSDDNHKHYIIITPQYQNNCIYLYDFDDDTFYQRFQYPSHFKPTDHVNALNTNNNELYVFGGFFSVFGSLHLNTEKWKIKLYDGTKRRNLHQKTDFNIYDYYLCYPYFINETELHVFHRGKHLKYDSINDDKFITLSSNQNRFTKYGKLLYIKHLSSKLMLFGGDAPIPFLIISGQSSNLNIWFCDTENRSSSNYKWKLFDTELLYPLDLELSHVILAYNYIAIVFDLKRNMILCLDLLLTKQWYLSPLKFPELFCGLRSVYALCVSSNVHFIQCKARNGFHIKLPLKQFIPETLTQIYKKHYETCVLGYIRREFEHIYDSHLPIPLKSLIVTYFPPFL